jgi:signal transduction histidine kinase/CheY-like chemotaxis protein
VKRDVTRERDLEQQLLQAQKLEAVGQLAGGVAHDFNNALGGVIGYADLALMEVDERDPVRPHLLEIRKAGERAAAIARQLLIFSRRQVVDLRVVAVDQVVEGLLKMLRRLLGEEVTLDTHIQGGMPTVRADVGQLEQVIINLCLNARDAMPTGGRITIAAAVADPAEVPESASAGAASDSGEREGAGAAAGPAPAEAGTAPAEAGTGTGTGTSGRIPKRPVAWIRLSIEDTGSGIPPEVKAHLFEPFFTTKPRGKGTGLGLAVVHGIIAKHGGAIAVDSEVGAGTTFRIFLPATGEPTSDRAPAPTEPAVGGTETVLVVDDDPGVREVAQRALVRLGYRALVASSAYEALGLADRTPGEIHVLLTDVVMPGPSGVDLSAEIRKTRPGIRVLFMSGHLPDKVEARGVKGSETEFIGKPFEVGNLARKLRRLLDRPRTEEGKRLA